MDDPFIISKFFKITIFKLNQSLLCVYDKN
jgi:hypothetical protein